MHRIKMTDIDQRIAKVCNPETANRYAVVYHNPNTDERWLVARVLPSDVCRYKEALLQQGCEIVVANMESGQWNSIEWLRHYRKDAPLREIEANLHALRWGL